MMGRKRKVNKKGKKIDRILADEFASAKETERKSSRLVKKILKK